MTQKSVLVLPFSFSPSSGDDQKICFRIFEYVPSQMSRWYKYIYALPGTCLMLNDRGAYHMCFSIKKNVTFKSWSIFHQTCAWQSWFDIKYGVSCGRLLFITVTCLVCYFPLSQHVKWMKGCQFDRCRYDRWGGWWVPATRFAEAVMLNATKPNLISFLIWLSGVFIFSQQYWWGWIWKWKWYDIRPSMVTHNRNLCSAFTHPKCTHTTVNTHAVDTHPEHCGARGAVGGQSWYWAWSAVHSLPPATIPASPRRPTFYLNYAGYLSMHFISFIHSSIHSWYLSMSLLRYQIIHPTIHYIWVCPFLDTRLFIHSFIHPFMLFEYVLAQIPGYSSIHSWYLSMYKMNIKSI